MSNHKKLVPSIDVRFSLKADIDGDVNRVRLPRRDYSLVALYKDRIS